MFQTFTTIGYGMFDTSHLQFVMSLFGFSKTILWLMICIQIVSFF